MDLSKINISSYIPAMPYKVRELFDKATNIVMNYTETEAKVVEATNDESWGPPGKLLQDLSQLSYSYEHYNELMGMLWKRCFGQEKRYWRRTYKVSACTKRISSLLVLIYLVKNGSDKVVTSAREHLYDLKSLENFSHTDEHGKDQGINVRHKVKEIIEFIQDDDRLRDERKKAKANRDKYIGVGSEGSSQRYSDRWNDNEDFGSSSGSSSTKKKDFTDLDGRWRSTNPSIFEEGFNKAEDIANKVKEIVLDQRHPSHDYSPELSDEESHSSSKRNHQYQDTPSEYRSKTKESDFEVKKTSTITSTQPSGQSRSSTTSNTNKKSQMVPPIPKASASQAPAVDLWGDDDGFTPYAQAPNLQSPIDRDDDDFGQFQAAPTAPSKQVTSPTSSATPSLWPTAAPAVASPSSSATLFDPFESLQPTGPAATIDLLQPLNSSVPASKPLANDLELFMIPTQPTQPSAMFFPQQTPQQTFMRPAMFQQAPPMMFANSQQQQQQQFNRPNNNSFNAVFPSSSVAVATPQQSAVDKKNTWSSAQGKIDISLSNLIPHTRGDPQKSSLPLNQLTSPTSPTMGGFPSSMMGNAGGQSMFPTPIVPMSGSGNRPVLK